MDAASGTGTGGYVGKTFELYGQPQQIPMRLTVVFSSPSASAFEFNIHIGAADGVIQNSFVGRDTPTKQTREWLVGPTIYQMQVKAPADGEWSYTIEVWR